MSPVVLLLMKFKIFLPLQKILLLFEFQVTLKTFQTPVFPAFALLGYEFTISQPEFDPATINDFLLLKVIYFPLLSSSSLPNNALSPYFDIVDL